MLLKAKFSAPLETVQAQRTTILRAGIIEQLNRGLRVTLVNGPMGYGKTTAVAQWRQQQKHPVAWINLDQQDNNPDVFWRYVYEALHLSIKGRNTEGSFAPDIDCTHDVFTLLLNELNAFLTPPQRLSLVLDNAHALQNPDVLEQFNRFLDYAPEQLNVIAISRGQPALHCQSRQSKGHLHEINIEHLKLNDNEAHSLFQMPSAHSDLIDLITQQCEGWPAALHIATKTLNDEKALPSKDLLRAVENNCYHYMADELMQTFSPELDDFLLKTAHLNTLEPNLCQHLLAPTNAINLIARLQNDCFFVTPSECGSQLYRYHRLFKSWNYQRLYQHQALWKNTLRTTADWLITQYRIMEALQFLCTLKDWPKITSIIAEHFHHLIKSEDNSDFKHLIDCIPEDVVWQSPRLLCVKTWLLNDVDKFNLGASLLNHAETLLLDEPATKTAAETRKRNGLLCKIYSLKAIVARLSFNHESVITLSKQALHYAENAHIPLVWRSHLTIGADLYFQGELEQAVGFLNRAWEFAKYDSHIFGASVSAGYLNEVHYQSGNLQQALNVALAHQAWCETLIKNDSPYSPLGSTGLIGLYLEANRLDDAKSLLEHATIFSRTPNCDPLVKLIILLRSLKYHFLMNDLNAAQQTLQSMEQLNSTIHFEWPFVFGTLDTHKARLQTEKKDTASAQTWVDENWESLMGDRRYSLDVSRQIATTICIKSNQLDKALLIIEKTLTFNDEQKVRSRSKARILQAIVLYKTNKKKEAAEILMPVIQNMASEGYINLFLEEGENIYPLIIELHENNANNTALKQLYEHIPAHQKTPSIKISAREMEILLMVDSGLSDKEMSQRLNITLGTVKTHLRNIYRKLNAKRRTQAVNIAKELGLIDSSEAFK